MSITIRFTRPLFRHPSGESIQQPDFITKLKSLKKIQPGEYCAKDISIGDKTLAELERIGEIRPMWDVIQGMNYVDGDIHLA